MEIFKQIAGYERYSVSNRGRVINNISGKELSQRLATNGYLRVNLRKGNIAYEKPHVASVHRLVADAFLMRENGKNYVNHIDGNKANNNVKNLEWCTASYNILHSHINGLQVNPKGKDNPISKKVYQFNIDGKLIGIYYGTKEAQRKTGVHSASVSACCNKKQKTAGGYKWSYEEVM